MTGKLEGAVALVTGAGGGIGTAICRALRDEGAQIALVDVEEAALQRAVDDLGDGDDLATFTTDLTDDALVAQLPQGVADRFGPVDVLVNNAGIRQVTPLLELSPADWRRTIDVDLTAPFVLTQAVIPGMVERGRGKIVNIASAVGELAFPDRAAYCVAKAGLRMLTKVVTTEFAGSGIWCNAVAPAIVETPLTSEYFRSKEVVSAIRGSAPMQRWAQADEIARPVVFLSGPDSDYVNGTTLFVDGGWTAGKTF